MLKPIFLLLQSRITTKVAAIKSTEWYMGQGEPTLKGGLTTSPLVAIRFLPVPTRSLSQRVQEASLEFDVFLFTDNVKHGTSERINPVQGIQHMDLADSLNRYLLAHRASLSNLVVLDPGQPDVQIFDSLNRTGYETDHGAKGIFTTRQRYRCHAWDHSAVINYELMAPQPGIQFTEITFMPD
jgi:hypothetical protein